jgi:hypothetical protein
MGLVKFPFGPATKLAPAHAAVHSITIENMLTFLTLSGLAAAIEIDLAAAADLEPGAKVVIDVIQGATGRNVTLDANIIAPDLVGVNLDRDTITLTWNGTAFVGGAWAKVIDAA